MEYSFFAPIVFPIGSNTHFRKQSCPSLRVLITPFADHFGEKDIHFR